MRIDKFLWNLWFWSRNYLSKIIKKNWVYINNEICFDSWRNIDFWDKTVFEEVILENKEFFYFILNKPQNYVSSSVKEAWYSSFLDLLGNNPYKNILKVVWRLDVDTTWLLLLTNNWDFIHNVINPKKDIFKKYRVKTQNKLNLSDIQKLRSWVFIDDDYKTKQAKIEIINDYEIYLSISEWRFHQVKKW